MPTNFLRPLRTGVFQVHIAGVVAAVLHAIPGGAEIYILADEARLLAIATGELIDIARRIAAGEFDNDFRFEISDMNEDGDYLLVQIATPSQEEIFSTYSRDPYGFVAREREAQSERAQYTLEERFDLYAARGW